MSARAKFLTVSLAQIPAFFFIIPYLMILAVRGLEGLFRLPPAFPPPVNAVLFLVFFLWGAVWVNWSLFYIHAVGQGAPLDVGGRGVKLTTHLMRGGPYAFCRNPMLYGYTCMFAIGLGFLARSWAVFIFVPLWFAFLHLYLGRVEERGLVRRFGDVYLRYRAEVPRLMLNPFGVRPRLAAARRELALGPKSWAGLAVAGVSWVALAVSAALNLPRIVDGSAAGTDLVAWLPFLLHLTWYGCNATLTILSLGAIPRLER